jgi:rhomboid protease GluP
MWGFAPFLNRLGRDLGFTQGVMWGCIILYVATLIADPRGLRMGGFLNFLSPSVESLYLFGASGAVPVFRDNRWWTVLSAGWLHAGLLHILFNMMWVRQLAPATADLYGASRMVIIYTVAGVVGFLASTVAGAMFFLPGFLRGAPLTVGASAPIFGLLGALIYYGRRSGSSMVGDQAKSWAIVLFIFGFIMPGVDNWAHLGGFAGGYAASRILDPLHPERLDHLVIALLCLGLTVVSIVVSIVHGLSVLGR